MFSIIIPSRPCQTDLQTVSPNQFAFQFSSQPRFSHVVVFILPGNQLPPDTAAAVYLQLPGETEFRFLGAIANDKPSAIFKINLPPTLVQANGPRGIDDDIMADTMGGITASPVQSSINTNSSIGGMISLGISVEPISNIRPQLQVLQQQRQQQASSSSFVASQNPSRAQDTRPSTKVLAQRIIKNAFNFLAGFAGTVGGPSNGSRGGVEVIPLKSFEEWWKKFERRVEMDPGFLEREQQQD